METINRAVCQMQGEKVCGMVNFHQEKSDGPTRIWGEISGLTPGKHGFHVHDFGDMSKGCETAGDHYNPTKKMHGGREDYENRHIGDLGNVEADASGTAKFDFMDKLFTLNGKYSVIGRAMVVHEKEDDLGRGNTEDSKKTGSSGGRVACGIIAIAKS